MAEPRGPTSKIEIRTLFAKQTATVRETVPRDDVTEALGRTYQAVHAALGRQGIEPSGAPFARYHELGNAVDLEAGLPVASAVAPEGMVKPSQLPIRRPFRNVRRHQRVDGAGWSHGQRRALGDLSDGPVVGARSEQVADRDRLAHAHELRIGATASVPPALARASAV